jgi:hypothetical protein
VLDGGTAVLDGGTAVLDGGTAVLDGGTAVLDGGTAVTRSAAGVPARWRPATPCTRCHRGAQRTDEAVNRAFGIQR